jgi:predicted N-acetyltransferase YhbS
MQIETFKEKHIKEVVAFLNETMPYDESTEELLKEQTIGDMDYDPDLALVAVENNKINGLALGICRGCENHSGIKIFTIRENESGVQAGNALLERLEKEFINRGVGRINIGWCPLKYLQPGIDPRYTGAVAILLKNGYQDQGTGQNMEVDLGGIALDTKNEEERLRKEGITIKRLAEEDRQSYMLYLKNQNSLWFYSGMLAYNNNPVSCHIALKDKITLGFACHGVTSGHYFGPTEVSSKLRGKGIGDVLLKRCLKDIKDAGEKKAVIFSVGPVYFYWKAVGAKIPRLLWKMSKDLKKK